MAKYISRRPCIRRASFSVRPAWLGQPVVEGFIRHIIWQQKSVFLIVQTLFPADPKAPWANSSFSEKFVAESLAINLRMTLWPTDESIYCDTFAYIKIKPGKGEDRSLYGLKGHPALPAEDLWLSPHPLLIYPGMNYRWEPPDE